MRGYSLIELVLVMLLMTLTVATFAPAARRQRDRAGVVGAREAVVALIAEARSTAMERGTGSVHIAAAPPLAEARSGGAALRRIALGTEFGVALSLSGSDDEVDLTYDALGLGRLASQTITFRRGSAAASLVVSGYGRVRRQ
jgi:type II secretory pathway pseudopilin PulG